MLHQQEWCWWYLFSKPTNDKRKCWKKQKNTIYRVFTGILFTGHLPGAAAPGIDVPSWCTVLVCPFLQPIGLVDYESLKKFICRVRLFSSRFLKQFMDWASTSSCDNLFHLLMTLWEKKYKRESQWQCFFTNFQVCPLVEVSSAFLKKCDQGVEDSPFISLNNSIKSALFLLSSRDHNTNTQLRLADCDLQQHFLLTQSRLLMHVPWR